MCRDKSSGKSGTGSVTSFGCCKNGPCHVGVVNAPRHMSRIRFRTILKGDCIPADDSLNDIQKKQQNLVASDTVTNIEPTDDEFRFHGV